MSLRAIEYYYSARNEQLEHTCSYLRHRTPTDDMNIASYYMLSPVHAHTVLWMLNAFFVGPHLSSGCSFICLWAFVLKCVMGKVIWWKWAIQLDLALKMLHNPLLCPWFCHWPMHIFFLLLPNPLNWQCSSSSSWLLRDPMLWRSDSLPTGTDIEFILVKSR